MFNPIKWFAQKREIKRLDRALPNPRSAAPRGRLKPHKRQSYPEQVLRTVLLRLVLLAGAISLAWWLFGSLVQPLSE